MSMLRSSKFVKYFVSFARSIAITQPRGVDCSLVQKSNALLNIANRNFASLPNTKVGVQSNSIDRSIQQLDKDVRRTGRVSRKELQEVFDEIRQIKHATSTQSLMIIRCCGNLVPEESPEVRTKLVKEIWETFEKLGVALDISHYNALLRVYLENEHKFSPTEFLANLENKGVEPNRVTFQRLIAAYCQMGDIDGATSILQFMKEKQLPVNESVFNSLITGHAQANDMESAIGILSVMKQANLMPSADTYTALLCGYAKHGDINSINKAIEECQTNGIELLAKDFLEVAYVLALNNHSQYMEQVLEHLKNYGGFNQDAKNTILRLIAKGKDKDSLAILKIMPFQTFEGETTLNGNFIVKQMVKANRSVDAIVNMCEELKLLGNERGLCSATEASLHRNDPEASLKLLTALSKQEEVCHHYYWPVLVQFGKARNVQGIINTLKQMTNEVGIPPSGETLRDFVIPYLPQVEQGVQILRQAGVSTASAAASLLGHFLSKNDIASAKKIALQYKANYNFTQLRRSLVTAFLEKRDIDSLVTIVQAMEDNDSDEIESGGRVLVDVAHYLKNDRVPILTDILNKYLECGIGISNEVAEVIQNKLSGDDLTQEISTLLSKLTSPELTLTELKRPLMRRFPGDIDVSRLLETIKVAESKGENVLGLKRQLLLHYCFKKDLEKATALKEEMKKDGFEFHPDIITALCDLCLHHEKLPEALEYYKQLKSFDSPVNASILVRLGALMCKIDKIDDAIALFKENPFAEVVSEQGFVYASHCWKLLNFLAEKGDAEKLKEIFTLMVENKYFEPTNVLLGPLIKVHLLKNDLDGALDAFEECSTKYRATPWKNELACKLIEKEDATGLQRLTDLSTQIHGEINSLYDLVLSFVECGRVRQARKILETPGLRTRTQRITLACERYTSEGHINHLESLVEVTKDMTHINRSDIYFHLLNLHSRNSEVDKALGLWTRMQEEDVQPSDQFLITLGKLLEKHGRPVPFQIPESQGSQPTPVQEENAKPIVPPVLKSLRRAVNAKDLDEVLELKNKLKPTELSVNDKSRILNLMLNSGRIGDATKLLLEWLENNYRPNIKTLSFALNNMAKMGDIDSLEAVGKLINEEQKKMISFINRHTHCMVEAGRGEEVLDRLMKDVKEASTPEQFLELSNKFPKGGIYSVLNSFPQLLPKFEEIEKLYRAKGIGDATNALWVYYTLIGEKEKAEEAWKNMKSHERFLFQPILKTARQKLDVDLADDLLNRCKQNNAASNALAVVYSCKMDVLLQKGRLEDSLNVLEEALQTCAIEDLNRNVLYKMKQSTELHGKEFKYTIPPMKFQAAQSSSSSSSSDSDNEEPEKQSRSERS